MADHKTNSNFSNEPEVEILSSGAEDFSEESPAQEKKEKTEPLGSEAELEEWKKKHDDLKEKLSWVAADFDNYKKRVLKEKEDYLKFAQSGLLKELLVVGDNLERALATFNGAEASGLSATLKQGVELTLRQFQAFLEKHNVVKIKALGEKFDPRAHEVMFQEETDQAPDETVLEELQSGYLLHERVLRPALVKVAKNHGKKADG